MITKKDLQQTESRIEKHVEGSIKETEKRLEKSIKETEHRLMKTMKQSIKDAFLDFYETVFIPHAERNEKEHQEIRRELGEKIDGIGEYIKDHEKRIRKLETITAA